MLCVVCGVGVPVSSAYDAVPYVVEACGSESAEFDGVDGGSDAVPDDGCACVLGVGPEAGPVDAA